MTTTAIAPLPTFESLGVPFFFVETEDGAVLINDENYDHWIEQGFFAPDWDGASPHIVQVIVSGLLGKPFQEQVEAANLETDSICLKYTTQNSRPGGGIAVIWNPFYEGERDEEERFEYPKEYMGQPIDSELLHTIIRAAKLSFEHDNADLFGHPFEIDKSQVEGLREDLKDLSDGEFEKHLADITPWFNTLTSAYTFLFSIASNLEKPENDTFSDPELISFAKAHADCLRNETPRSIEEYQADCVNPEIAAAIAAYITDPGDRCSFVCSMMRYRLALHKQEKESWNFANI